jgi:pyridinium-3,5-biscarboxylic acid mononucleotide synthase
MSVHDVLTALQKGEIDLETATRKLQGFEDLGHTRVDLNRAERNGAAEVIYGSGKTAGQIIDIIESLRRNGNDALVTRLDPEAAETVVRTIPEAVYHARARLLQVGPGRRDRPPTKIAVVCAGTSDLPVAEEAGLTAEFYGNQVERVYDAGVAGLHRLLASLDSIRECRVVIVVAGMEGALPSVVGGLVKAPVIAVPTSVGYGASFGGVAALLGMLNSCASGLSVVNIDNGFGAGFLANRINRL